MYLWLVPLVEINTLYQDSDVYYQTPKRAAPSIHPYSKYHLPSTATLKYASLQSPNLLVQPALKVG